MFKASHIIGYPILYRKYNIGYPIIYNIGYPILYRCIIVTEVATSVTVIQIILLCRPTSSPTKITINKIGYTPAGVLLLTYCRLI